MEYVLFVVLLYQYRTLCTDYQKRYGFQHDCDEELLRHKHYIEVRSNLDFLCMISELSEILVLFITSINRLFVHVLLMVWSGFINNYAMGKKSC